jgi:SAM-dependent methyltransferase/uncharacterized protein YceK
MHDDQRKFWDAAAATASFTHPLDAELLRRLVGTSGRILDFGCGYGRLLAELRCRGFQNLEGIDASEAMVARARKLVPDVPVAVCGAPPTPHADASFDAILVFAVLTCIPRDEDQRSLMTEVLRLLVPGGYIYASDFLLHSDRRDLERYRTYAERFGTFGIFEVEGGGAFRHHSLDRIRELAEPFETVVLEPFAATTMRGNPATGIRFVGRKPNPPEPADPGSGLPAPSAGLYLLGRARRRVSAAGREGAMIVRGAVLLVLMALLCGCQTSRSFDQGCPGVYSGVRYYGDQIGDVPADGKIFFTLDLPLSAVADTLLLPATFFVEREKPDLGWALGCRWAGR